MTLEQHEAKLALHKAISQWLGNHCKHFECDWPADATDTIANAAWCVVETIIACDKIERS